MIAVLLRADLDTRDVAEAHDLAFGTGLDDDVAELLLVRESSHGIDGQLELRCPAGRGADLARCDLHVLLANGIDHVTRGQVASGQLLRIEPDPHGIVTAAEHLHLAHAGRVVPARRARSARRSYADRARRSGRPAIVRFTTIVRLGELFTVVTPRLRHFLGKSGQRLRNPVLYLHLRPIDIGADAEGDGHSQAAIHGGGRGHVEHVLDANDRLLQAERQPCPRRPSGSRRGKTR